MRTRRILTAAVAAGLAAAALSGCSGGGGDTDGDVIEGAEAPEDATKLNMLVFAELLAAVYDDMAVKWNEEHPDKPIDLDVAIYAYHDMHDKLLLAVNAGQGLPDLADIEVNKFSNFVKGDNPPLVDLTAAAEPYVDDIVQARLDLYSRNGKIYGYPTHVGAFVAFYNTE